MLQNYTMDIYFLGHLRRVSSYNRLKKQKDKIKKARSAKRGLHYLSIFNLPDPGYKYKYHVVQLHRPQNRGIANNLKQYYHSMPWVT